ADRPRHRPRTKPGPAWPTRSSSSALGRAKTQALLPSAAHPPALPTSRVPERKGRSVRLQNFLRPYQRRPPVVARHREPAWPSQFLLSAAAIGPDRVLVLLVCRQPAFRPCSRRPVPFAAARRAGPRERERSRRGRESASPA